MLKSAQDWASFGISAVPETLAQVNKQYRGAASYGTISQEEFSRDSFPIAQGKQLCVVPSCKKKWFVFFKKQLYQETLHVFFNTTRRFHGLKRFFPGFCFRRSWKKLPGYETSITMTCPLSRRQKNDRLKRKTQLEDVNHNRPVQLGELVNLWKLYVEFQELWIILCLSLLDSGLGVSKRQNFCMSEILIHTLMTKTLLN